MPARAGVECFPSVKNPRYALRSHFSRHLVASRRTIIGELGEHVSPCLRSLLPLLPIPFLRHTTPASWPAANASSRVSPCCRPWVTLFRRLGHKRSISAPRAFAPVRSQSRKCPSAPTWPPRPARCAPCCAARAPRSAVRCRDHGPGLRPPANMRPRNATRWRWHRPGWVEAGRPGRMKMKTDQLYRPPHDDGSEVPSRPVQGAEPRKCHPPPPRIFPDVSPGGGPDASGRAGRLS